MFHRLVEKKIREALEAGEFDGLEGAGRPVNLDAYFSTPEELRAGYAVLKNAGVVPEEARLLGSAHTPRRVRGRVEARRRRRGTRAPSSPSPRATNASTARAPGT